MTSKIEKKYSYGTGAKSPEVFTGVQIGAIHNPNTHKSVFVVHARFMHGDADGYETEEAVFDGNDELRMVEYLNFLSRCSVRYPHGKGGCDGYDNVIGYQKWVEGDIPDEDDYTEEEINKINEEYEGILSWPRWEGEYIASFDSAWVVYYDEAGIQHSVEMIEAK